MSSMRRAVVAAREWLSGRRHVVVERRTLPEEMPDGPFDPIVTSEILYVVVGSGFIGCEAAASLALRGAAVTLASHEQSPQRKRLGDEVGERTEGWLRDFGVDLRLGVRIEGVERTDGGLTVNLDDGTPSIREPSSSRPALGPASDSPRRPVSRWTTGSACSRSGSPPRLAWSAAPAAASPTTSAK